MKTCSSEIIVVPLSRSIFLNFVCKNKSAKLFNCKRMSFQPLGLIEPILKAIKEEGYTIPTPIQAAAIPIVLKGLDLLGCAQTGTGKTAAFSAPILQLLSQKNTQYERKRKIRSLIVTPTRELAIQIGESVCTYGKYTTLTNTVIFGGVNQTTQVNALRHGVDILVATPGRLLDLINQKIISLSDVEIFVLDEADRMLDMGFIHDIKKLLAVLPSKKQSLFFSATMPPEIVKLSQRILHNPQKVEVTPVSSTADTIQQFIYFVDRENKLPLLIDVLKNRDIETVLVFTRTKHGADKVVRVLQKNKIKAEAIHGNKAQNARQRALSSFKEKSIRVLVATDIAARGIDVDNLQYVINFELPNIPESYVHRIGRTGRAGAEGTAYSFCNAEEKPYLKDIEKLIGKKIPVLENHDYPLIDHNPVKPVKQPRPLRNTAKKKPTPRKKVVLLQDEK
jgi:ATP-dependent RNA helicase RhlE